jgi:hypothetical protein
MSTRNKSPTKSDVIKLGRILSYLNGTRELARRYYSDDPTLYITVDASYGVHTKGNSHSGFFISVGRNSAPVLTYSAKQKDCVATGSMEAEYIALSQAVKKALPLRYLLEQLGFPQPGPMVVFEDNMSAINLAIAPTVTKNSKHIAQRHHFIRTLVKDNTVKIVHLPTADMTADLLTKPMAPKLFLRLRAKLMNSSSAQPAALTSALAGGCQLNTTSSTELLGTLGTVLQETVLQAPLPYRDGFMSSARPSVQGCADSDRFDSYQQSASEPPKRYPPSPRASLRLTGAQESHPLSPENHSQIVRP